MPWISCNDIPCDAPPCNKLCGTKEYDESIDKPQRRKCVRFDLDKNTLNHLYHGLGWSLNQIARDSESYFPGKVSHNKVVRYMKKYGIPRRNRARMWPSNKSAVDGMGE